MRLIDVEKKKKKKENSILYREKKHKESDLLHIHYDICMGNRQNPLSFNPVFLMSDNSCLCGLYKKLLQTLHDFINVYNEVHITHT